MEGQLNAQERQIITDRVRELRPRIVLEVGTWLGGGSTLHILKALHENGEGHLWGIEAFQHIYDRMIENIRSAGDEVAGRFTPLFGFSDKVIPEFLADQGEGTEIQLVFLDGGDNPMEQVTEFQELAAHVPVGGVLLSHDAKLRKGKWLVPYMRALDNWECTLHDVSDEGLFEGRKVKATPSEESRRRAAKTLASLRRQPAELVGRLLPKPIINFLLRLMPTTLVRRLTQGRK